MKLGSMLAIALFSMSVWASDPVWIDVRSAEEFSSGQIEGAHNIAHHVISEQINGLELNKDVEILLYCRSGRRASFAKADLEALGYSNVKNIGGFSDAQAYKQKQ